MMAMPIQEATFRGHHNQNHNQNHSQHLMLEYEEDYDLIKENDGAIDKVAKGTIHNTGRHHDNDNNDGKSEPFHHPSSPISVHQNNDSLTHENLELLDQSLTLTDNGDANMDVGAGAGANADEQLLRLPVPQHSGSGNGPGQPSVMTSSYVTFPSSKDTQSRANSVISSAATSTTNNTTKRRRPRPWDNHVNANSGSPSRQSQNDNIHMVVNGETTPLLPPRHKSSIYSAKTEKRGNTNTNQYHRQYTDNVSNATSSQHHDRVDVPSSPSLKWSGGVFTAETPAGGDGNGHVGGGGENNHRGDIYGSFPYSNANVNGGGGGAPNFFTSSVNGSSHSQQQYHYHHSSTPITSVLLFATTVHFILMALYNTFLHYQAHRLHTVTNGALYGEGFVAPYWISYAGRIYNGAIGPNVPTLILFGGFHPFLALNEWWRVFTGVICSTSVVDLSINLFLLRVAEDEERKIGSWNMLFCYGASCFMGALASILDMSVNATLGNFTGIGVTGLGGAGIAGVMCTIIVKQGNMHRIRAKGNQNNRGIVSSWTRCGYPHFSVVVQILGGMFLPYKSVISIIAGGMMGVCCGWFIVIPSKSLDEWNDADSQASSIASDLEEAFSPSINTPPRFSYDDSPPPPPSSSSKGLDTPIMRRSILTSPEEDDEIDMMQSLNAPGGLKQRSVKASKKNFSYEDGMMMNGERDEEDKSEEKMNYCTDSLLRLIGMMCALLMIALPMFYIGVALQLPSEQSIADSLYGCRTMHAMYEYVQDDEGDNDDGTFEYYQITNGVTVCGEVCIPTSIYDQVIQGESGSSLQNGTCKQDDYQCQVKSDAFDAGFLAIERELYIQGVCAQNSNKEN